MFDVWRRNLQENLELVQQNHGPALVTVVSGSETDSVYWREHLVQTRSDVFRKDGNTFINSVCEGTRKGNFLGTFNAWIDTKEAITSNGIQLPKVALMSMVFGKGKRLSPFTQALGNRKPAFLTPMKSQEAEIYLRTVDLSNLYSNIWIQHLSRNGFHGLIVKWGDEAIVPGRLWELDNNDYSKVDAIRFVWKTEVTETLAREKEWIAINEQTGLMQFQYPRQDINSLKKRLTELKGGKYQVGVNLGSLAISYEFLNAALDILQDDIHDPQKWVDWDPYVWLALFCKDESQWQAEKKHEDQIGKNGINNLEKIYPNFYSKIAQIRGLLESRTGRSFAVSVLDFGEAFWTDIGLHITLRKTLEALTKDSAEGIIAREFFGIPHDRDKKGNIVIRSKIPESADIRDSVVVDTVIEDKNSVIRGGLVLGGRHRQLYMPYGGSALFCAVDQLVFSGPSGIAFRLLGSEIDIPEGGRYTTLLLPEGPEVMVSNEAVRDYNQENYSQPILGNRLSFEEAGQVMAQIDGQDLERRFLKTWETWLS